MWAPLQVDAKDAAKRKVALYNIRKASGAPATGGNAEIWTLRETSCPVTYQRAERHRVPAETLRLRQERLLLLG